MCGAHPTELTHRRKSVLLGRLTPNLNVEPQTVLEETQLKKDVKRIEVGPRIYAKAVYPKYGSPKAEHGKEVNILLTDDEALNLAWYLVQGARESKEMTIMASRKAAVRKNVHRVTVTYEPRMKK